MRKYRITFYFPNGTNSVFETDDYTIGTGGYIFINTGDKSVRFNGTWFIEERVVGLHGKPT